MPPGPEIVLSFALSLSAGTPHFFAAASISAIRPAAPARDMRSKVQFTDQEPPVTCSPTFGSKPM